MVKIDVKSGWNIHSYQFIMGNFIQNLSSFDNKSYGLLLVPRQGDNRVAECPQKHEKGQFTLVIMLIIILGRRLLSKHYMHAVRKWTAWGDIAVNCGPGSCDHMLPGPGQKRVIKTDQKN